ncbi:MAG: rhomboid family intramembrane serine protease, partial [Ignavibacteriaceae bacterium]|nr:rhomboid family intramembrane serine protease [Ignavibacteriaceae bacterium]
GSNVAHLAHLGGAIAGFIYIMLDKRIDVPLKRMLNRSGYRSGNQFTNPFSGLSDKFKKRMQNVEEAKYYDINQKKEEENEITQEEIDRILDKIGESGYQNLTEKEKKILFDASKKMN